MPIPKPNTGETQDNFISRCMEFVLGEGGTDQDQAAAICYQKWRDRNKEESMSDEKENTRSDDPFDMTHFPMSCRGGKDMTVESAQAGCLQEWEPPPEGTVIPKRGDLYDGIEPTEDTSKETVIRDPFAPTIF